MEFLIIFGNFVTKNRAFGNNTTFLQQFFRFQGNFPPPRSYALEKGYGDLVHQVQMLENLQDFYQKPEENLRKIEFSIL